MIRYKMLKHERKCHGFDVFAMIFEHAKCKISQKVETAKNTQMQTHDIKHQKLLHPQKINI